MHRLGQSQRESEGWGDPCVHGSSRVLFSTHHFCALARLTHFPPLMAPATYDSPEYNVIQAAGKGNLSRLKELVEGGARVNDTWHWGTAMHEAAKFSHLECIKYLLEHGVSVDSQNEHGITPLGLAAEHGQHQAVGLLLECGANVHHSDSRGYTPVHLAAHRGRCEVLKVLAGAGVDLDTPVSTGIYNIGATPLSVACRWGHVDVVRFLLEMGCKVNRKTVRGETALHGAASSAQCFLLTKMLLEAGADPSVPDGIDGELPIHGASSCGESDTVGLYLKAGIDPNSADKGGWTPLHRAANQGQARCVEILLKGGAATNIKTKEGYTPLSLAKCAVYDDAKVVQKEGLRVVKKARQAKAHAEWTHEWLAESPPPSSLRAEEGPVEWMKELDMRVLWAEADEAKAIAKLIAAKEAKAAITVAALGGDAATSAVVEAHRATVDAEEEAAMKLIVAAMAQEVVTAEKAEKAVAARETADDREVEVVEQLMKHALEELENDRARLSLAVKAMVVARARVAEAGV